MPIRNIGPVFANLPEALTEIEKPSGRYRLDPNFPGSYALWNMDAAAWKKVGMALCMTTFLARGVCPPLSPWPRSYALTPGHTRTHPDHGAPGRLPVLLHL
jgi:hypothetical protein